eukprot:2189874-Karenia_brevis.AAC.1
MHRCGIPQGCPFSMMIIALLLRPWHLLTTLGLRRPRPTRDNHPSTTDSHVVPRSLADDLLILASGPYVLH